MSYFKVDSSLINVRSLNSKSTIREVIAVIDQVEENSASAFPIHEYGLDILHPATLEHAPGVWW
jgi:hypothetical protein